MTKDTTRCVMCGDPLGYANYIDAEITAQLEFMLSSPHYGVQPVFYQICGYCSKRLFYSIRKGKLVWPDTTA